MATPHVDKDPVATDRKIPALSTLVGTRRSTSSPTPSCPEELRPQHRASPDCRTAQAWYSPALIATMRSLSQTPSWHATPSGQARPQAPHEAASVSVSISHPFAGSASQSAKPKSHSATAHAPSSHAAVPFATEQSSSAGVSSMVPSQSSSAPLQSSSDGTHGGGASGAASRSTRASAPASAGPASQHAPAASGASCERLHPATAIATRRVVHAVVRIGIARVTTTLALFTARLRPRDPPAARAAPTPGSPAPCGGRRPARRRGPPRPARRCGRRSRRRRRGARSADRPGPSSR